VSIETPGESIVRVAVRGEKPRNDQGEDVLIGIFLGRGYPLVEDL
jgi:hypothetical protein